MTIKTEKARRVLSDTEKALEKFEHEPVDVDFRHLVVLCCALLRAVGHVLERENTSDPDGDALQKKYFKENIQNAKIFKEFIEKDRNNILKEYRSGITWESVTTLDKAHYMRYPKNEGEYGDYDFRDLVAEAIEFWDRHLTAMESAKSSP